MVVSFSPRLFHSRLGPAQVMAPLSIPLIFQRVACYMSEQSRAVRTRGLVGCVHADIKGQMRGLGGSPADESEDAGLPPTGAPLVLAR